jgi:hypothetical protein
MEYLDLGNTDIDSFLKNLESMEEVQLGDILQSSMELAQSESPSGMLIGAFINHFNLLFVQ